MADALVRGSEGTPIAVQDRLAGETRPAPLWRRFSLIFWLGIAWILLISLAALFANLIPIADPLATDLAKAFLPIFSENHLLGTDGIGRDILARIIHGARLSLQIAYTAPILSLVFGVALGMSAGYFRGRTDSVIGIFVDSLLAFPNIVAIMAVLFLLGRNMTNMILVLAFFGMVIDIRVSRANTIMYAERDFVLAARAQGASHFRILIRELLPNVIVPVLALMLLGMSRVIIIEGALAFLGVGIPPPAATWGKMIADGFSELEFNPHITFVPSVVMFLTILSFNLIGDRLRGLSDTRASAV